jgi:hypothetical protein
MKIALSEILVSFVLNKIQGKEGDELKRRWSINAHPVVLI